MTRQRRVILEELRKLHTHPCADEVYTLVRQRLPRISLGTVYRNLETLSELGEIQKLETGGNIKRFDGNPTHHYHIRCIRCSRLADAPTEPLPHLDGLLNGLTEYTILGHRLEFVGVCADCAATADRPDHLAVQRA